MSFIREIHPLEPQRHRHSMLAPRVCAPRVTRCSLGHVIWSVQLACSILLRSDSCQGDGRQRHLMMHGQCPIPVYSSQPSWESSVKLWCFWKWHLGQGVFGGLQLKDPLWLFVKRRQLLYRISFLSLGNMSYAVESDKNPGKPARSTP